MVKLKPGLVVIVACASLVGCGGAATSTSTTATASSGAAKAGATAAGAKVAMGPVRGSLKAPNHSPVVGRGWSYTVKVTDPAGKPMPGTVEIEFLFARQVIGRDTPPTHQLRNGTWRSTLTFPKQAIGEPLTFRAVVHTRQGSITLDWPVTVKR
jgi:hypothetical protein